MALKKTALTGSLLLFFLPLSAQASDWHALVVGADYYADMGKLDGAVNDARLLDKALRRHGVKPTLLIDHEAEYDKIRSWWEEITLTAQPGDVLFFSYAGHGGRESEHFPGSEQANSERAGAITLANDQDEVLILPAYTDQGTASRERIVDHELLGWVKQATDKGLEVVVVTDVCFGGGLSRSALSQRDYGDAMATTRNGSNAPGSLTINPEDKSRRGTAESARLIATDYAAFGDRLLFATPMTDESKLVPEVMINGQEHGVLSYTMAQIILGAADTNGDGITSYSEAEQYLRNQTIILSNKVQDSALYGVHRDNRNRAFMGFGQHEEVNAVTSSPDAYKIYVEGAPAMKLATTMHYQQVSQPDQADFRWNTKTQTIIQSGIGVVGYDIRDENALASFVDNRRLVMSINKLGISSFAGSVLPEAQQDLRAHDVSVFESGDKVSVYLKAPEGYDYVIALNIPSINDIQVILATEIENLQSLGKEQTVYNKLLGTTSVTPPFGADHLLLIAINEAMVDDIPFLSNIKRHASTNQDMVSGEPLLTLLKQLHKDQAIALAIMPFTTVKAKL